MSDELKKRELRCRQQYSIIANQFPVLMARMDAIKQPPKKKQRRSEKNPQATAETQRAAYKELADTIRGYLKELGEDVDEEDIPGASGPTVEDK